MDLLSAMRVYVRVVERGSMSAAARDLGMGQPAVSERIERLEAYLDTRLLRRNTRAVSVTDTGSIFYARCKTVIDAADDALAVVREDLPVRGTLRIAAPHGVGEVLLPPILLRLRELHPSLKFDLVLNDRLVDPVTEGVDVSLRLGDPGDGTFVARRLGHVRRLLVAAPSYLERCGAPPRPQDLIQYSFARVAGLFNTGQLPLFGPDRQSISAPIDIAFTVSHWRPLHALLVQGGAIGILQEPACRQDVDVGRLRPLLEDFTVPGFDLYALYSAHRSVAPRVRALMNVLEKEIPAALSPVIADRQDP